MLSLLTSRVFLSEKQDIGPWWDGLQVKDSFWRVFYHDGDGISIETVEEQILVPSGRYMIIPGWLPFTGRGNGSLHQYSVRFDIPVLSPYDIERLFPKPVLLPEEEPYLSLGSLWRQAMDSTNQSQLSINTQTHSFVQGLSAHLVSTLDAASIQILSERLQPDSRVTKVISEIEANLGSDLTLALLAEKANLSRDHLIRLFRRKLGLTPKQYILDLRIKKAARLLNSTRYSIEQIAEELGFSDRYHFTRAFNQSMGINPGEYRRSFQPSSANVAE